MSLVEVKPNIWINPEEVALVRFHDGKGAFDSEVIIVISTGDDITVRTDDPRHVLRALAGEPTGVEA